MIAIIIVLIQLFLLTFRFLFELSKITHYEQRLRTLHYKKKFNIWYAELKPKIVAVLEVYIFSSNKPEPFETT